MEFKESVAEWFKGLQDRICQGLETEDGGAKFQQDLWERPGGGGGRTRIIQSSNVIEKGGVNFSAVHGTLPDNIAQALQLEDNTFFATGVSIVIHPINPWVPIIHMNVRYFETGGDEQSKKWWFGGGIDLTPHYIIDGDARYFHQQLKNTCDRFDSNYYPEFKKWADDYFYIKHRKETRGIGGIFFDRLNDSTGISRDDRWKFVQGVGDTFLPTYVELIQRNRGKSYEPSQKEWQKVRRGRYVEFNLVYDKGTKFGLDTDGRIESILMSLPKEAGWEYDYQTQEGSEEANTLGLLKKDVAWV